MKLSPFFENKHNQAILALTAANIIWGAASPLFAIGSFLVFGGIFFAEGRLHYHPIHKLRR